MGRGVLPGEIRCVSVLPNQSGCVDPYGVSIRYPNELFFEEHHAKAALKMTKEMLTWAKITVGIDEN